jgi:hypothetical protein
MLEMLRINKSIVTSKEFEFLHKSCATAVAMATMTFQDGRYFGFKVV